jgi:hypothetical protein
VGAAKSPQQRAFLNLKRFGGGNDKLQVYPALCCSGSLVLALRRASGCAGLTVAATTASQRGQANSTSTPSRRRSLGLTLLMAINPALHCGQAVRGISGNL